MIKLGTIGTHWITQRFVAAIQETGRYQLQAVYSRKLETAQQFATQNHAVHAFDHLTTFYEAGGFDTVYIASPNSVHFAQIKQAIQYDKNVIVEKPAVLNPVQMAAIQALLAQHPRVHFFEAARNIHTVNFRVLQRAIGQLPQIQGAELTYAKYSSRYDEVLRGAEPNIFSLAYGGGALQDLGVYVVYEALALFGVPQGVRYYPQLVRTGVDGKGTAILSYDQFTVVLNVSKVSNTRLPSEIYGLKELIEIDNAGDLTQIAYIPATGQRTPIGTTATGNPMVGEAQDFARIIDQPLVPANQADYQHWLALSSQVNQVLFELRTSADIVFADERPRP